MAHKEMLADMAIGMPELDELENPGLLHNH
jgi:hypothetical protein